MAELDKVYNSKSVEQEVYKSWIEAGSFAADPTDQRRKYCIVIPPPNVTAPLHLGHALNNTLQDVLIRYKRMGQFNTLWMPGTDHAGIATQTVVEKRILAEEGKRRTDFEREEFVGRVQAWKDEYEQRILNQLKLMGCSCDWDRTRFTMDDTCARAVRETFFKLFKDGLIYRGKRLVNWDPATQTVLADDEVEHEDVAGNFWYLQYPLVKPVEIDGCKIEHVTVATTRPETMLGDTAVAMNPSDPRAELLVGQMVRLPIVGRKIPIIADEHVVLPDPESEDEKARFSTGFLKVTPAHDPDDWQIGQRHDLPIINVMAPDGSISDKYGWEDAAESDAEILLGMDRFEAREAIVEWFRKENLLEDVRQYTHPVGHSYRSHVPIEPYLSDQWYVAVKKPIPTMPDEGLIEDTDVPVNSLAGLALKPLLDGRVKFVPERYAKTYQTWLENLRDWPISRQLWWGHQIPVWYLEPMVPSANDDFICAAEDSDAYINTLNKRLDDYAKLMNLPHNSFLAKHVSVVGERWEFYICTNGSSADSALHKIEQLFELYQARNHTPGEEAPYRASPEFPSKEAGTAAHKVKDLISEFKQDPDVLDTWFSSALWPFSTLGWPEDTPEVNKYYPGDLLCTAREIITLWVSRMVMMGQYCAGDIPFTDVFIHAMIQDGEGRKMSKSLGNGIDPLDIIDSHGADAMRYTLAAMTTQTQDVRMPVEEMDLPDGRRVNTSPKFDVGRNFCNKLWNASRFAMMNLKGIPTWGEIHPTKNLADAWILSRLQATVRDVTSAMSSYRFNEVCDTLYHFMWDELCDWYLEIIKTRINSGENAPKAIVAHCLDVFLRLLHPVCPFITEQIWASLNSIAPSRGPGDIAAEPMLIRAQWPQADSAFINKAAEENFTLMAELIRKVRNVRKQHEVAPSQKVDAIIEVTPQMAGMVGDNVDLLTSQAALGELKVSSEPVSPPANASAVTAGGIKLYVLDIIDRDAEVVRLTKHKETLQRGIKSIEAKLGNENFLEKAPQEVIEKERHRCEALKAELAAVLESLESLE